MAAREVLALNISVPRIEVPQTGDTYLFPRASAFGGNLTFSTDNAYDIGADGATRPRNGYFAGTIIAAGNIFAGNQVAGSACMTNTLHAFFGRGGISAPADGQILLSNDGGSGFTRLFFGTTSGVLIGIGAGTPESAVAAPVGSLFFRTDGGAGTSMYVKESGSGNTGWVGK